MSHRARTRRRAAVVFSAVFTFASFATARAEADEVAPTCADAANDGQPLRRASKLLEARRQFLLCARDECPDSVRTRCTAWVAEVDAAIPSIVVRARNSDGVDIVGARVVIDGSPSNSATGVAVPLDPGVHKLRVETNEGGVSEQDIVVAQGEKNRVLLVTIATDAGTAAPPAPPKPPPHGVPLVAPAVAYGIGALGVVSLAAFAFFEVKAHNANDELAEGCGKTSTCASSELDAVRRDSTIGIVAGGVGVAAIGASLFLLLWRTRGEAAVANAIEVRSGGSRASFAVRF